VKSFGCRDQFLCMAFAQLTFRESLRDIEACLRSQAEKLYHMEIRGQVARNTLANANETRDWRIYADFARRLIGSALRSTLSKKDLMSASRIQFTSPRCTIRSRVRTASWALRLGRKPYEQSEKSCS